MSSFTPPLSANRAEQRVKNPYRPSGIGLRFRVFLRRARLDAMLGDGISREQSPELSLRASQLTRRRQRRAVANSLEEVLRTAQGDGPRRTACPPLARRDIRACRAALLQLAQVLREESEADATGVVLARRLLMDGTSPLYVYGRDDELWHSARRASAALEGYTR
jgi:hypothetical protein